MANQRSCLVLPLCRLATNKLKEEGRINKGDETHIIHFGTISMQVDNVFSMLPQIMDQSTLPK